MTTKTQALADITNKILEIKRIINGVANPADRNDLRESLDIFLENLGLVQCDCCKEILGVDRAHQHEGFEWLCPECNARREADADAREAHNRDLERQIDNGTI